MLNSRIVRREHAFLLEVEGKQVPLYGYMSYQPAQADYEGFRQAGVHLFFTGVYAGDRGINQFSGIRPFRPGFWLGEDRYDFSAVDEDFHRILDGATPGTDYLIPRLMIEPPTWWEALHPGELCRDAQGTPLHQSYCSEVWRRDTEKMMRAFQRWLEESGWDRFVVGWHVACGNTEEFLTPVHHDAQYTDYSEPARRAFSRWALRRNGDMNALNAAWHSDWTTPEEIRIPSPAHRAYAVHGDLRDMESERYTVDYYLFYNESLAQAVIDLCAAAKRATGRRQVIGSFFGYTTCNTENPHHAAEMIYLSDDVDFLASPFCYTDNRAMGVDWPFPGAVESAQLHGKPWFMEADVRTCLSRPISQCMKFADPVVNRAYDGPVWYGPETVEGSLGQMGKALARVLTHNTAVWWFDMWGGWYRRPEFMEFHRRAYALYRDHVMSGGAENSAPVALFVDEALFSRIAPTGGNAGLMDLMERLGAVGTPYRMFLMSDFAQVDPARYRLAIFFSVTAWPQENVDALENWKRDGRILAFTGPFAPQTAPVSGVSAHLFPAIERPDDGLAAPKTRLNALLGDVTLAEDESGVTALLRRNPRYSIYADISVCQSTARLRMLVAAAGGQIYSFGGDSAYASDSLVAIHAASDGIKRVCVPFKARLTDALTNTPLPGNESFVDISMQKGQTLLMKIEKNQP